MANIQSIAVQLVIISYLMNVGLVAQKTSSFTCDNATEIEFVKVCDGEVNCADGTDEIACDSNPPMLYYIYHRIVRSDIIHMCSSWRRNYCPRTRSVLTELLSVSGVYLNDRREFSIALPDTKEESYPETELFSNIKNVRVSSNGPQFYISYERYPAYSTPEYVRKRVTRSGSIQNADNIGQYLGSTAQRIKDEDTALPFPFPTCNKNSKSCQHDNNYYRYPYFIGKPILYKVHTIGIHLLTNHIIKMSVYSCTPFILLFNNFSQERNFKNMVFDLITTRVYYLSASAIKVCDQNLLTCVALSSKFINNPVFLTISSKRRLLFWIEEMPTLEFCLYKYAIDMSSKPRVLLQDLKTPAWLTVDVIQERVYWVDNVPSVHSIKFDGNDHEVILRPSEPVSSLAAFNSTIYWTYEKQSQIWMCSISDCSTPTLFQQINKIATSYDSSDHYSLEVGSLTLDQHLSSTETIQNPCTNSSCSHFCLLRLDTSFRCYCEGSDQPLSANKNNGYCEDATMIVTYQNDLYVLGFSSHGQHAPIINGKKININSASTVTYDSMKGNVILTETEQQKIYSWVPHTGDLNLLSDDGFGSIRSIEFDNCANNLYWIDPVSRVIRVMNVDTRLKLTILEGNSTYVPIELTLAPTKGYMFVQFLKNSSIIIIERIPMDGRRVGPPIHVDEEIDSEVSLHLYYRRETDTLYLLDRQTNKIRYQQNEETGFRDVTHSSQSVSKMESWTTLNNAIYWLEDDMIYRGGIDASQTLYIEQKIPLGFKKTENGTLKMAPVVKFAPQPSFSQCLQNNGGCQELCLVSDEKTKFACACTGNKILVNGSLCRDASVNVMNSTTRDENSMAETSIRLPKNGLNTDGASTTREEDVIHTRTYAAEHQQTKSTCIKSCPPIRDCSPCVPSSTDTALSTGNKSTGTCPVCPSSTSALSSDQSSTSSAFYWIFNSVVAILLGFVLGYVFRKYSSRSQHSFSIFHRADGTLELEQMRAESVMPLFPKVNDESANEESEDVYKSLKL